MDSKVLMFFASFAPTLLLVASACFVAIAAKRKKESGLWLIFIGFALQIAGTICSKIALASTGGATGTRSKAELVSLSLIFGVVGILTLSGGIMSLIGWIRFAMAPKIPDLPKNV